MLAEPLAEPSDTTVDGLLERYGQAISDVLFAGDAASSAERELSESTIEAIESGQYGAVTLEEAATVLASVDGAPSADVIQAEVQDTLLVGMANAVLDVDALAADLDSDLTPRAVQQRVEGRAPMRLDTYAAIRLLIARE